MEVLFELFVIVYDDEYNDGLFLVYDVIGICYERVGNYLQVVEMFGKVFKEVKIFDWINENMNFGLLCIGIVFNKKI